MSWRWSISIVNTPMGDRYSFWAAGIILLYPLFSLFAPMDIVGYDNHGVIEFMAMTSMNNGNYGDSSS